VVLRDVPVDLGLGSQRLSGRIGGSAGDAGRGLALRADARLADVQASKLRLSDLQAKITKHQGKPRVQIRQVSAKAHGGGFDGRADLVLGDPNRLTLSVSLKGASLADLLNTDGKDPAKRSRMTGILSGDVRLDTILGRPDSVRGSGQLLLKKVQLAPTETRSLPVLHALLQIFERLVPGRAFDEAYARYDLRGEMVHFREIDLRGPAFAFVGSGTLQLRTGQLNLTFLSGPAGLPRLPRLAADIYDAVRRQLVEIRVTGTVTKPVKQVVPLRGLTGIGDVVRRLLRPERLVRPVPPGKSK
jgi:hypothetical protein